VKSLAEAVRDLVLERQPAEDLPAIATAALTAGEDSPSLRELAGTAPSDYQTARDLLLSTADELNIAVPTPEEAWWSCAREWALDMVEGQRTPHEASSLIWWNAWEPLGRPDELTPFVGLASEWQDAEGTPEAIEGRRVFFDQEMLDATRRFLAQQT
jgi:hypothetical protein